MKKIKISGVYKITNNITGDFYIGSSKDIKYRWATHKCLSRWKRNPNVKLYKAFINYGLDNFTFEILEETAELKKREQYWIKQLSPTYNDRHADGIDTERRKKTTRRYSKDYHYIYRDKELAKMKDYYSRLCLYEGETLTLSALEQRFRRQGIPHPTLNASKYLLSK